MPISSSAGPSGEAAPSVAFSFRLPAQTDASASDLGDVAPLLAQTHAILADRDPLVPALDFEVTVHGETILPPLTGDPFFPLPFQMFVLGSLDPEAMAEFERIADAMNARDPKLDAALFPGLGIRSARSWCPREASFPYLGTTRLAGAQIGQDAAPSANATGEKVFVVVVDQGINAKVLRQRVPGAKFAGGWKVRKPQAGGEAAADEHGWVPPGTWPDGHGTRMAELVLSIAPAATILDLPLLPPRIRDLRGFLPWAAWVFWSLGWVIPAVRARYPDWSWVICNAWSVYDLRHDFPAGSPWNYGQNPRSVMNRVVAEVARSRLADLVFAAGNGGQFGPDPRCGPGQVGPGQSIYGVSALREVLTVGAIRNDRTWLGYSAQGPSPCDFHSAKPDVVAPSQFTAPGDAARGYGGTSAACALSAGAIAAARSLQHNRNLPPAEMLARAVATARPLPPGPGDPSRIGAGLLHVPGLLALP